MEEMAMMSDDARAELGGNASARQRGRKTLVGHEMRCRVDDGGHDGLGRDEWRRRDDDAEASRRCRFSEEACGH